MLSGHTWGQGPSLIFWCEAGSVRAQGTCTLLVSPVPLLRHPPNLLVAVATEPHHPPNPGSQPCPQGWPLQPSQSPGLPGWHWTKGAPTLTEPQAGDPQARLAQVPGKQTWYEFSVTGTGPASQAQPRPLCCSQSPTPSLNPPFRPCIF